MSSQHKLCNFIFLFLRENKTHYFEHVCLQICCWIYYICDDNILNCIRFLPLIYICPYKYVSILWKSVWGPLGHGLNQ